MKKKVLFLLLLTGLISFGDELTTSQVQTHLDWTWTIISAFSVFFMQAGFTLVEGGFVRAKNMGNIIMKNTMDFCVGIIGYFIIGFAIMFGPGGSFFGAGKYFFGSGLEGWDWTFFIFQGVFAATASTIVSGALAERTKFYSYVLASFLISAIIYPISGHWVWGGLFGKTSGWIENLGFIDFAGSTAVHSVGGWIALAAALVVGPRIGKYGKDGKINAIPGHSLTLASLGVFILWFAWFGFNAGSTTAVNEQIGKIAVNTALAPAAAALSAMFTAQILYKTVDIGMTLNGILSGLVGVTAGCANVDPWAAIIIGITSGILVVHAVRFFDKIKIDDPVGAVSVHGVCGFWGTLCAGIFDSSSLFDLKKIGVQLFGGVAIFIYAFGAGLILFTIIKYTLGLRVGKEEELEGLDLAEHLASAYPEFI